jgi:hypothetical protein
MGFGDKYNLIVELDGQAIEGSGCLCDYVNLKWILNKEGVDWVNLAQDTTVCLAYEYGTETKGGLSWCNWATVKFSKRALLGGVPCGFKRTPFKQVVNTGSKQQSREVAADVGVAATGTTKNF